MALKSRVFLKAALLWSGALGFLSAYCLFSFLEDLLHTRPCAGDVVSPVLTGTSDYEEGPQSSSYKRGRHCGGRIGIGEANIRTRHRNQGRSDGRDPRKGRVKTRAEGCSGERVKAWLPVLPFFLVLGWDLSKKGSLCRKDTELSPGRAGGWGFKVSRAKAGKWVCVCVYGGQV